MRRSEALLVLVWAMTGCAADPAATSTPNRTTTGNSTASAGSTSTPGGTSTANTTQSGSSGSNSKPGTSTAGSSTSSSGGTGTGTSTAGTSSSSGTAGSSSSGTSGSSGGSGTVDCSALPLPTNSDDIISTFEDGTGTVMQVAGRGGGFYMFNDGTGMQKPPTGGLPDATHVMRCESTFALCTSGSGFTTWGAGFGTDLGQVAKLADGGMGKKTAYDASAYKGVSFWAKSNSASVSVRLSVKDKNTAPEGGVCDAMMTSGAMACNDDWGKSFTFTSDWKPYTLMFSEMRQSGWGAAYSAFDVKDAYSIQFQVNKGIDFDLCIDDLAFVR